jgi:hypothetical protein
VRAAAREAKKMERNAEAAPELAPVAAQSAVSVPAVIPALEDLPEPDPGAADGDAKYEPPDEPTGKETKALGSSQVSGAKLFSGLLSRTSKVRISVRAIARILNALRKKTFKVIPNQLTDEQEKEAWKKLVSDQNDLQEKEVKDIMAFKLDGNFWTRQRWSEDCHVQLFNCKALPVLRVYSPLGKLLVENGHKSSSGACRSNEHTRLHLRTSSTPAFLIGNVNKAICQVKDKCVNCRKEKIKVRNGQLSSFSPQMSVDRFKNPSLMPYQQFSCDLIGPVLCTDQPGLKQTRSSRCKYVKKWILIIVDCSGVGAVKYVMMSNQSSASFCQALKTHFAEAGTIPSKIYTDEGSQILCVARKEREKSEHDEWPDMERVKEDMKRNFPNIIFESAGSSSQYKNAVSEIHVKLTKKYLRNVLGLKPNSSLPKFTNEGINLLLKEMSHHLNQRPLSWVNSHHITANHFINPYFDQRVWNSEVPLADKYIQHEEYKAKMRQELVRLMQVTAFLPGKWSREKARAVVHDIVLVSRGKSKFGDGILEFARVDQVSPDGRNLNVLVSRVTTQANKVKTITVDSRNCHLIYRPTSPSAAATPPSAVASNRS